MATTHILVVDSDDGFGNMLTEALKNSGLYTARRVQTGGDALQAVVEEAFDLVIIDMAVNDMAPATLIHAVREAKSGMRIMMIPFIGQDLPANIKSLDINGILTKPFFVGALPDLINQAISPGKSRPAASPTPAPPPKFPSKYRRRHPPEPPPPAQTPIQPAPQTRPAARSDRPPQVRPPRVELPQPVLPPSPRKLSVFYAPTRPKFCACWMI
ncbi:MAG: response regulator [Anaerolineae bacterium]